MAAAHLLEIALRHDRAVVISALLLIIGASWIYILAGAGMAMSAFDMTSLPMALGSAAEWGVSEGKSSSMGAAMTAMATPANWTLSYALVMIVMWWVMMVAMMLPSAAPMILLYALIDRKARERAGSPGGFLPTSAFTLGYLLVWGLFSVIAASLQWAFEEIGLLSPMLLNSTSAFFAGVVLLFAGAYQLTPIKRACLRHCRGPIQFLSRHWRDGAGGALRMGVHHGAYCLGCCWGLMAVLFFGSIMNLYWIAGLAVIVLLEKLLPLGPQLSTVTGGLLLIWGASFLYSAVA